MAQSENSKKNLKPFTSETAKKNGSKGGKKSVKRRREKRAFMEIFTEILDENVGKDNPVSRKELIARKLAELAFKNGNIKAIELIAKFVGEYPSEKVELSGKDGKDLIQQITVEVIDKREDVRNADSD